MAITINGTGTITGISAGGYPDGTVTAADLASSLDLTGKTVTLPSGTGGKVLNVYSDMSDTTATSLGGNTYHDIPNLSVTFTPSSTNNKVLVFGHVSWWINSSNEIGIRLLRGSTDIGSSSQSGSWNLLSNSMDHQSNGTTWMVNSTPFNFLDSPATTSSVTYKPQIAMGGPTGGSYVWINRGSQTSGTDSIAAVSVITAMEIAP